MSTRPTLSGPPGSFFLGHLSRFGRDPLGLLEQCAREYGDFVALRFVNKPVLLVNDAAAIEQVLATNSRQFRKTLGYRTPFMRRLFGQGLLTSEGEFWTRQRRLAQPAFHRDRVAQYARAIVQYADELLATWQPGETRAVHLDMMKLTTRVVVRTLFNSDVPREINDLGRASATVMERFTSQWSAWRIFSQFLPTPGSRRFEQVMRNLDNFIYGLIQERRAANQDVGDLLSMLLLARDDDGQGMTDRQLRDELTTLMVAGLDTTALALTWTFYLLSQNPAADAKLAQEVQLILNGRAPGFPDLPRLRYAEMVIKEAMRLYPPAWVIGREALQNCELAGHPVAGGTSVIMSQWLAHRDARHFENPLQFQPERWTEENARKLPKYAYFPFGGGPRICIGYQFAMMEAVLVLAMVAQRYRLTASPNYAVTPWPSITLQPRGGISLKVETRIPAATAPAPRGESVPVP